MVDHLPFETEDLEYAAKFIIEKLRQHVDSNGQVSLLETVESISWYDMPEAKKNAALYIVGGLVEKRRLALENPLLELFKAFLPK